MAVLLIFFTRKFWRAGKKWRGFRGGNFLPASRFVFSLFLPAAGGGLKISVGIFLEIGSDFD